MSSGALAARLARDGLRPAGVLDGAAAGREGVLVLVAPGAGFWEIVTAAPEWADGGADPVDRWSRRVLDAVAAEEGGTALYPFGGPPWHPFHTWAVASGAAVASPVGLLADTEAGLWISYRGALVLPGPAPEVRAAPPCPSCETRPCLTACPVGALTGAGYDVPACKAYLATEAGRDCREGGCRVRRACPAGAGRMEPARAAYHMGAFRGA